MAVFRFFKILSWIEPIKKPRFQKKRGSKIEILSLIYFLATGHFRLSKVFLLINFVRFEPSVSTARTA